MTAVRERPILFSGPMARAILEGMKGQTRRIVRPQPAHSCRYEMNGAGTKALHLAGGTGADLVFVPLTARTADHRLRCPYGAPGDTVWIRETWAAPHAFDGHHPGWIPEGTRIHYRSTWEGSCGLRWRPSIFMPHWASRITLEITDVRVERLQDISEEDAKAEGVYNDHSTPDGWGFEATCGNVYRRNFARLWDSLNRKDGTRWADSPWVWVLSFRRITEEAGR